MTGLQMDILLVEDDLGDVELTREALSEAKVAVRLHTVPDGDKALAFLRKEPLYSDAVRPDLILLDLNLPRKDGRELLRELRSDPILKSIPVVVLTASDAEADVLKCYGLGANCFVTKPMGFQEFTKVVKAIEEFWFTVVRLAKP